MEMQEVRNRFAPGRLIFIGGAFLFVVMLVVLSHPQLLNREGWSKDQLFDDGRMAMRATFKADPNLPAVGTLTLMAKVNDASGYTMLVDHVHFSVRKNGETVAEAMEGEPVGDFSIRSGDVSLYRARVELPAPGRYLVVVAVQHRESSYEAVWPLEVRERT